MRARLLTLSLMLVTAAAVGLMTAQQPAKQAKQPPANKTYVSASDVTAMMAKAKSERKQDQANLIQSLLQLAPYSANLEYRGAVGPAAMATAVLRNHRRLSTLPGVPLPLADGVMTPTLAGYGTLSCHDSWPGIGHRVPAGCRPRTCDER